MISNHGCFISCQPTRHINRPAIASPRLDNSNAAVSTNATPPTRRENSSAVIVAPALGLALVASPCTSSGFARSAASAGRERASASFATDPSGGSRDGTAPCFSPLQSESPTEAGRSSCTRPTRFGRGSRRNSRCSRFVSRAHVHAVAAPLVDGGQKSFDFLGHALPPLFASRSICSRLSRANVSNAVAISRLLSTRTTRVCR